MRSFLLLALLAFVSSFAVSQNLVWKKTHSPNGYPVADLNGGVLYVNFFGDTVVKYDANGDEIWSNLFRRGNPWMATPTGLFHAYSTPTQGVEFINRENGQQIWDYQLPTGYAGANPVGRIDNNGNMVLLYHKASATAPFGEDAVVLRLNPSGQKLSEITLPTIQRKNLSSSAYTNIVVDAKNRAWAMSQFLQEVSKTTKKGTKETQWTGVDVALVDPSGHIVSTNNLFTTLTNQSGPAETDRSTEVEVPAGSIGASNNSFVLTGTYLSNVTDHKKGMDIYTTTSEWRTYVLDDQGKVKLFKFRGKGSGIFTDGATKFKGDGGGNGLYEAAITDTKVSIWGSIVDALPQGWPGTPAQTSNVLVSYDLTTGKVAWKKTTSDAFPVTLSTLPGRILMSQNNTIYSYGLANGTLVDSISLGESAIFCDPYGPQRFSVEGQFDGNALYIARYDGLSKYNVAPLLSKTVQHPAGEPTNADRPLVFALEQNYPNPFNPQTAINFSLASDARVRLSVFNLLGQEVAVLANGDFGAGSHSVTWNAAGFGSGLYYYRLVTPEYTATKRMMYIK